MTEVDSYFINKIENKGVLKREPTQLSNFSETFQPSKSIDDFYNLFLKIKSANTGLSYIHFHKFINKLKFFCYFAILEKNFSDLKLLNIITDYFKISYLEIVHSEFIKLKSKSKIIQEGLYSVLNFECNSENKNIFHEINNFLDIFIKEATDIASSLQFLRNNKLRNKLFKLFGNTLKEEKV